MNRNQSRDIFVGRTADGGRMFLNFAYSEFHPVLISGSHIPYRCRNADNVGQMVHRLPEVVAPAAGWTLEELEDVRKVWDQYQLADTTTVPKDVANKVRAWVDRR